MNLDVPRTLPIDHLSHSSITTYLGCPEKWRRRYLDLEYEPSNPKMIVGRAVGRSVTTGYLEKMKSGIVSSELIEDTFETEWADTETDTEIDWQGEEAGVVKDSAAQSLRAYAGNVMPLVLPDTVEESFEITLPAAEWNVIGYIDIVTGNLVTDVKTSMKRKTQAEIDRDLQATMYVAAKQLQGAESILPAFSWHAIKRPSPAGRNPAEVEILHTTRTQMQVNQYLERIAAVAREIDWRVSTGNWQGAAPGYWLCSEKLCGYWNSCPYGGKR